MFDQVALKSFRTYILLITDDGEVLRLSLTSGELIVRTTLAEQGAPAYGRGQIFDGSSDSVVYVTDEGKIARLFFDIVSSEKITLQEVVEDTLNRSFGIREFTDASALSEIYFDGFAIFRQQTAFEFVTSLAAFFAFNFQFSETGVTIAFDVFDPSNAIPLGDLGELLEGNPLQVYSVSPSTRLQKVEVNHYRIGDTGLDETTIVVTPADEAEFDNGSSINFTFDINTSDTEQRVCAPSTHQNA